MIFPVNGDRDERRLLGVCLKPLYNAPTAFAHELLVYLEMQQMMGVDQVSCSLDKNCFLASVSVTRTD